MLVNKDWIVKNAKTLKISKFIFGVSSLVLLLGSFNGDLQRIKVMEKETGLNFPTHHRVITNENQRKKQDLTGYEVIARVDNNLPLFKISLAFASLVGISAFAVTDNLLEENEALIDYQSLKSIEASKMDVDTSLAIKNRTEDERTKLGVLEYLEELTQNPTYLRLKQSERAAIEMQETGVEVETEEDEELEYNPFADADYSAVEPTDTNQKDFLTHAQCKEVYQLYRAGVSLAQAFPRVIPEYNETNINWNQIKSEFLTKIKEITNNEKR